MGAGLESSSRHDCWLWLGIVVGSRIISIMMQQRKWTQTDRRTPRQIIRKLKRILSKILVLSFKIFPMNHHLLFQESLCASLCRELKFAIFCGGSTKPMKTSEEPTEDTTPHQENGLPFMPMPGFSSSSPSKGFASWREAPLVQPLVKDPEGSTYYRYGRGTGSDVWGIMTIRGP